ncbi:MAG: lipid II:glycine glycyltransferase FemX [Candidatus Dormibacteraceae bacterium]
MQAREGWHTETLALPSGARALILVGGPPGLRLALARRGPVPATPAAVADLVAWSRARGVARLRLEPEAPTEFGETLRAAGWAPVPPSDPVDTLLVPLREPEAMLASFHPKHRYNIRLALRRGVTVEVGEDAPELLRQHAATAARQHLRPPSLAAYRRRLEHLPWCRIYVARVEGEAVAANMVVRFGARAVYLFGGSSGARSNLQPTYALQWAAMQDAWAAGCTTYDLWGVPPSAEPGHPWHGLWQFKTGFRGAFVTYCGAWEYPIGGWRAGLGRRLGTHLPRPRLGLRRRRLKTAG